MQGTKFTHQIEGGICKVELGGIAIHKAVFWNALGEALSAQLSHGLKADHLDFRVSGFQEGNGTPCARAHIQNALDRIGADQAAEPVQCKGMVVVITDVHLVVAAS